MSIPCQNTFVKKGELIELQREVFLLRSIRHLRKGFVHQLLQQTTHQRRGNDTEHGRTDECQVGRDAHQRMGNNSRPSEAETPGQVSLLRKNKNHRSRSPRQAQRKTLCMRDREADPENRNPSEDLQSLAPQQRLTHQSSRSTRHQQTSGEFVP